MKTMKKMELSKHSFRELYLSLDNTPPKKAFIKRIMALTMSSETTVRCWIAGVQNPVPLAQKIISKELGVPTEVLFPANKRDKRG